MIAPGDIVCYSFRNFHCMFECAAVTTFPTGTLVKAVPGSVVSIHDAKTFEPIKSLLDFEYEYCKKADIWQCAMYEQAIGV